MERFEMKKNILVLIAFVLVMLLLATACNDVKSIGDDPLDGTIWVLFAYRKTLPIPGTIITATFEDGEIHGSAGCNSFGGSYEILGDKITFEDVAITEMACLEPAGVLEQEQVIMKFIWDAYTYRFSEGRLQIFRSDGEALTFDPSE